ncbi:MAG TPA: HNH endonuclease [Coleofasciculaceae cyanobacterium]|jgi:5-methylcytosine-specific restriction endonuclease McrA
MKQRNRRPPREVWQQTRERIWQRDQGRCQGPYCQEQAIGSLPLKQAHIDHIVELSSGGRHGDENLRTLCRGCHSLRASPAHRGMISGALREGVIPADWRSLVWEG